MKKWTVMIYMAGDNNLSQECIWAIKEMYRVGVTKSDDVAVVVQFDPETRDVPTYRYDIGKVQAVQVSKSSAKQSAGAGGIAEDGRLDPHGDPILFRSKSNHRELRTVERVASPTEIIKFVKKVTYKHKAEHYMLVLAGHGSGAQGDALLMEGNPPSYLSIARLGIALGKIREHLGKPLDILGLDACDMSMVEVGYQFRDSVKTLVAAEGFEKNSGWIYYRILEVLNESAAISPTDLAAKIVETYVLYYSDYVVGGISVDLAACDLSKSEELAKAITKLARALKKNLANKAVQDGVQDAIILAHWRAQSYKFEEYVDLWDFCDLLEAAIGALGAGIAEACRVVKDVIDNRYVLKCCFSGAAYQYSHGVSICLPWSERVSRKYRQLAFEETGWPEFVDLQVLQTRRRPRGEKKAIAQDKRLQPRSLTLDNLVLNAPSNGRFKPVNARVNPPLNERVNPPLNERVNPPLNERVNPPLDERGLAMLVAKMKNPAVWFYEDDCVIQARKRNDVTADSGKAPYRRKK